MSNGSIGMTGEDIYSALPRDDECHRKLGNPMSGGIIKDFYKDATVFITGGTGFLGKVLIEKLLRTCTELSTIYVLMRPKRGLTPGERFEQFQKHEVFNRIRESRPKVLDKMMVISGDISGDGLALSHDDEELLKKQVSIVFHVAATVKFNEDMKDAADLNTLGTLQIMEFCGQMENLKSVVHVSTAYCNPNLEMVGEKVYETQDPITKDQFLGLVKALPRPLMNMVGEKIQGSHPNTYTLTKSMAEQFVAGYNARFPICIVRPSIVTGSIAEPYPGWVDNVYGITGIMMEIGRGTISSIMCDQTCVMDLIPVDIVCNAIITAAWSNHRDHCPEAPIKVINCTSGEINPVIWHDYGRITEKWARILPSKYVMLYPNFSYRTNRVVHFFVEMLLHFLPAIIFDVLIRLQGGKPIMLKIAKRIKSAADTGEFFAMHNWVFQSDNMLQLIRDVRQAEDGEDFNCDMSAMDWDEYVHHYMWGIRRFVLKDDDDSLKAARTKVKRLYWTKVIFQLVVGLFIVNLFLRVLTPWSLWSII